MTQTDNRFHWQYVGKHVPLFMLGLVTGLLTTVTLGIYRFWAKTRIRKYIWSSATLGGDSFEYTGTGLEKFLGFLTAVVILAFYLAIVQLVLFYFGLSIIGESENPEGLAALPIQFAPAFVTVAATLPLIFFAQYRARRYRLARTRWRGLRFGMDNGAWGFAVRALWHWFLTVVTLGILLPRKTFWLEKYVTDRSWYGDARFEQNGKWSELFPAMKHLLIGVGILVGGVAAAAVIGFALALILAVVGTMWTLIGFVSFRVRSFAYLTRQKTLDGHICFRADPKTSTIVARICLGGVAVSLIAGVILGLIGDYAMSAVSEIVVDGETSAMVLTVALVALQYLAALVLMDALVLAWITQPIIRHLVQSISVLNAEAIDAIRQRASDSGADAEGFADALDIGGGL